MRQKCNAEEISSSRLAIGPVMLQLLKAADYRAMPWRNGGGITHEIAALPSGDGFAWRISLATIAEPGPFSTFPGCDRYLSLVEGRALQLALDGQDLATLGPGEAVWFAGEAAVGAALPAGSCRVLNLMLDRKLARADVELVKDCTASLTLGRPSLFFALDGSAAVRVDGDSVQAERFDLVRADFPGAARVQACGSVMHMRIGAAGSTAQGQKA